MIGASAEANVRHVLIGMAHRARLNVLVHVLKKPYAEILAEFKDPARARNFREDLGWTGDVKYHLGARRAINGGQEVDMIVTHASQPEPPGSGGPGCGRHGAGRRNPVDKQGRAALRSHSDPADPDPRRRGVFRAGGGCRNPQLLSLARIQRPGGTIHIIADNQLGYTTTVEEYRSSLYASGVARGL